MINPSDYTGIPTGFPQKPVGPRDLIISNYFRTVSMHDWVKPVRIRLPCNRAVHHGIKYYLQGAHRNCHVTHGSRREPRANCHIFPWESPVTRNNSWELVHATQGCLCYSDGKPPPCGGISIPWDVSSHEIPRVCSRGPAGTIGITHSVPRGPVEYRGFP